MDALGIANFGLRRLNEGAISSFTADSTAARVCATFFPVALDEAVGAYDWSFAKARAPLSLDEVTTNLTDYTYMYDLPADALRIRAVTPEAQYILEGRKLYSDEPDLTAVYLRSLVDDSTPGDPAIVGGVVLPVKFEVAVALRLAYHVAMALKGDPQIVAMSQQQYYVALTEAQAQDAQDTPGLDDTPERWEEIG